MSIDRETALKQLGPRHLDLLRQCLERAWDKYEALIRPVLPLCHPTAQATIIREFILEEVRHVFAGEVGITLRDDPTGDRFLLEVNGFFVIQFRKLTTDFHTVNNPTETSKAFDRQEQIEGYPALPRLTAGYQLGQYRTDFSGIWLAFLVGNELQWYHDLRTGEYPITLDFPRPHDGAADLEKEEERRRKTEEDDQREEKA
ncbi:MAG: hypothetical protein OXI46_00065 [Gemmatimonadota bacterium]|nr:hypothetical protein [Gemmatimonadota bacterium]